MAGRAGAFASRLLAGLAALAAVLVGLIVLGILVPRAPANTFPAAGGETGRNTVWIVANPIHTDIVLPATPGVLSRLSFLERDGLDIGHPDLATIAVGWGGRAFYTQTPTWADLTLDAVWRSATLDRSVLHLSLGGAMAAEAAGTRRLELGDAAFAALLDFVAASFEPGPDGAPAVLPGAGYGRFDRFYEARGRFNLLAGCNTWTAAALRAAGVPTGAWSPLPPTLLWGLTLHAPEVVP
ncbi:TIGR02117 family protein [Aureimonas sp. ME7]|uniref:TIGR02117 family protein n=1 Tax=Aureimonas sp. ME7 TaxID=2744252 RepID=UPI0015F6BD63|nr:TIGR02117 family protein [Aureimonas sp. ME7]